MVTVLPEPAGCSLGVNLSLRASSPIWASESSPNRGAEERGRRRGVHVVLLSLARLSRVSRASLFYDIPRLIADSGKPYASLICLFIFKTATGQ